MAYRKNVTAIKVADLIGKDVSTIRGDVRGGRYEWADPLVRTLTSVERRVEKKHGNKETWITMYWKPESRSDGQLDCGYSGWEENHFNEIQPVILIA